MNINIYSIEKASHDEFSKIVDNYKKMLQKYAKVNEIIVFNKKISSAQNRSPKDARKAYSEALYPYLKGYNIALHPDAKEFDSFEFSKFFDINRQLNLFIGGAYGFEDEFLQRCDKKVSLSQLTMSHKIAKIVLFEQVYRALTILNKHAYHK